MKEIPHRKIEGRTFEAIHRGMYMYRDNVTNKQICFSQELHSGWGYLKLKTNKTPPNELNYPRPTNVNLDLEWLGDW